MIGANEFIEAGRAIHGHLCPATPTGLAVGAAAMNRPGLEHSKGGQLLALVEPGDNSRKDNL